MKIKEKKETIKYLEMSGNSYGVEFMEEFCK
jgi:Ran GTPase-activating protein (RanGAP) involved in mRNA processing and transport